MIQGMFDPEMYSVAAIDKEAVSKEKYESAVEVFKFHEGITSQQLPGKDETEFNENVVAALADRWVYYAIPIPHRNSWVIDQTGDSSLTKSVEEQAQAMSYNGVNISSASDISTYAEELQRLGVFNYEKKKSHPSFPCILKYYAKNEKTTPKLN